MSLAHELDDPTPLGMFLNSTIYVLTIFRSDFDPEDEQYSSHELGETVEARGHYLDVGWVHPYVSSPARVKENF